MDVPPEEAEKIRELIERIKKKNNENKYWVALSSIEEIDSSFIQRLYNYFGDIETAFNASDLSAIDGLSVRKAENFSECVIRLILIKQ